MKILKLKKYNKQNKNINRWLQQKNGENGRISELFDKTIEIIQPEWRKETGGKTNSLRNL